MKATRKMGPIGKLLGMLPGAGQMEDALAAVDDSQLDRVQAIIRGMTPQQRADILEAAGVELALLVGNDMAPLAKELAGKIEVVRAESVDEATEQLKRTVRPGDAVLVKASNSIGLAKLVAAMAGG